jgi:antagonist of KipI
VTITVVRAAPYLTIQDFGRLTFREVGVPRGGAMDRAALGAANAVIGNEIDAAGLEWALGGGSIRFDEPCVFALAGASAEPTLAGAGVQPVTATRANAGDVLEVGRFSAGRFLYVAVAGGIDTELLLGSRSTYLPAHFGGVDGKLIHSREKLPCGSGSGFARRSFSAPSDLVTDYSPRAIRVVPGPQWSMFNESDRRRFFEQRYTVARSSDRMGYRLEGEPLTTGLGLLPSEAVCEGTIQIPPDGLPIVLMADSPTVGGYPKMGVVATSDLPILAQLSPGESFHFEETTVKDAQRRLRRAAASLYTLRSLALQS